MNRLEFIKGMCCLPFAKLNNKKHWILEYFYNNNYYHKIINDFLAQDLIKYCTTGVLEDSDRKLHYIVYNECFKLQCMLSEYNYDVNGYDINKKEDDIYYTSKYYSINFIKGKKLRYTS